MTVRRTAVCALCGRVRPLCQSHIIPEFFYDPLYDPKHRFHVIVPERSWLKQKGAKEYLLCEDCENRFSKLESYGRRVFFGGVGLSLTDKPDRVLVADLDYASLKLFQLSILWRAGASRQNLFAEVHLGRHEDVLRTMLLSNDPGSSVNYGCVLCAMIYEERVFSDLILEVKRGRIDGFVTYRFAFGGFFWVFFVSKQVPGLPWSGLFVKEDGTLTIAKPDLKKTGFLERLARSFGEALVSP